MVDPATDTTDEEELRRQQALLDAQSPDVGAAFTGQQAQPPLQSIMAPAPQTAGGGLLSSPADRAALLSIGLQLMQPLAFGQTVGGHIGQAIGAGGESASEAEASDLKQRIADQKLQQADEKIRIAQQVANDRAQRGLARGVGGLSAALQYRMTRDAARDTAQTAKEDRAQLEKDVTDAYKGAHDIAADPTDPDVQRFKGKSRSQIRDVLQAERSGAGPPPAVSGAALGTSAGGGAAPAVGATRKQGNYTYTWDGQQWQ